MMKTGKFGEEAIDEIDKNWNPERKALPELGHKMNIIIHYNRMEESYGLLHRSYYINRGRIDHHLQADFESWLLILFDDIREMIYLKNYTKNSGFPKEDKEMFIAFKRMALRKQVFNFQNLWMMKGYLLRQLNNIGILNLLIEEQNPFDDFRRGFG